MVAAEGEAAVVAAHRARAFGLDIEASFPAPGLPAADGEPAGRPTRVDLVDAAEIDRDWPAGEAERVLEERFDGGSAGDPARTIDAHPVHGFRLYARHFGLAHISRDGTRVRCSPPDDEPWSWQRFLVGRILPWAAVVQGLEAFHASGVTVGGRAVAFVGPTGAGKTSLAIRLVAMGERFLTDDVLSVESRDGELLAHPGAGIAAVRDAERRLIAESTWSGLGAELGHSGKTYLELPRPHGPAPLAAIYFLRLGGGEPIERLDPDPRLLLGSTFVLGVKSPERLRNQLDVCARIGESVPLFALRISPDVGSQQLAELVLGHAREVVA